jgi:hypothetical protein
LIIASSQFTSKFLLGLKFYRNSNLTNLIASGPDLMAENPSLHPGVYGNKLDYDMNEKLLDLNHSLKASRLMNNTNDLDVNLETREGMNSSIVGRDPKDVDIQSSVHIGHSRLSHTQTLRDVDPGHDFNLQFYRRTGADEVAASEGHVANKSMTCDRLKISGDQRKSNKSRQNQMHCRVMTEPNAGRPFENMSVPLSRNYNDGGAMAMQEFHSQNPNTLNYTTTATPNINKGYQTDLGIYNSVNNSVHYSVHNRGASGQNCDNHNFFNGPTPASFNENSFNNFGCPKTSKSNNTMSLTSNVFDAALLCDNTSRRYFYFSKKFSGNLKLSIN